jgi:hypothetical protein
MMTNKAICGDQSKQRNNYPKRRRERREKRTGYVGTVPVGRLSKRRGEKFKK